MQAAHIGYSQNSALHAHLSAIAIAQLNQTSRPMKNEIFDVLIIGSGHSGGMAAKILTEKGIRCLMLNAGPVADVSRDAQRKPAYELPYRGFRPPGRLEHVFQADEFNANVWVDEQEVPYTFDPAHPYNWVRVRLFGGRSLFWSRQSFRLSDYEFKAKSHDGFGEDWPISLADLAPVLLARRRDFPRRRRTRWPAANAQRQLHSRQRSVVGIDAALHRGSQTLRTCPYANSAAHWAATALPVR